MAMDRALKSTKCKKGKMSSLENSVSCAQLLSSTQCLPHGDPLALRHGWAITNVGCKWETLTQVANRLGCTVYDMNITTYSEPSNHEEPGTLRSSRSRAATSHRPRPFPRVGYHDARCISLAPPRPAPPRLACFTERAITLFRARCFHPAGWQPAGQSQF